MRLAKHCIALALGASGLFAADARAEPFSSFSTTDRQSDDSLIGADIGIGFMDPVPFDDDQSLRLDFHGQYLFDDRAGIYGMIPFSRLFSDTLDGSLALGNLEAGGYYIAPAGDLDLVLRGGLVLPTADGNLSARLTNGIAAGVRITDIALAYHDTTWLRLGASPLLRSGDVFVRTDLGLDVPLRTDAGADPLFRINVGGGVDLDPVSLLAELALVLNADAAPGIGDDNLISGALTARFHGEQIQPGLSLVIPIDDSLRDVHDLGLVFSFQVHLD